MKSLKKTLVLLVVLSMILSAVSPVFAFNDVIDEDYAEQANKMAAFGVFTGDANGNFNAEENITRAEMAVVIGRLMGLTTNEANANQNYASNFSDVKAGEWYTGWVNLVAGRGIISGFPDGTFRPNEKVTQAQAVTMIVKALGWGVVVDQTGTWPANYITKASELRLFKDAVESNSELVTRGNVAIYCYNALTAKTWDVTSSEDGKLTSSKTADTILAKYFSDFVNDNGEMKLVEDATVTVSGATTSAIGSNQVVITATFDAEESEGIATFIDAESKPRKNAEESTYKTAYNTVVAYVPAEVANIASMAGKKVDVIFGKDNEVAYLVVADDALEAAYVTAWDLDDEEIEINGTAYDFADTVTVKVFNYALVEGVEGTKNVSTALTAINTLLTDADDGLNITNPSKYMTRNVIAEVVVNADDEIETINFKFSADYTATTADSKELVVSEYVVEKVSSKNVLTTTAGKIDLEDLEDDDDPRVIRNNEIATLYDIEVGDVITEVKCDNKVMTLIVVADTVEGDVNDYVAKTNAFDIDGTDYVSIASPIYNENGDVDEFEDGIDADDLFSLFEEETVTAYLNMAGEVVAFVGESEATGTVLGVVTVDGEYDEDSDDVKYIKVRIMAEDGSEKKYSIYNKKSSKDVDEAEYNENAQTKAGDKLAVADFKAGTLVRFEADSSRVIKSDDIEIVDEFTYDFKANSEVVATKYDDIDDLEIDIDKKTINGDRFTSSTIVINPLEEELISSWEVLTEVRTEGEDDDATEVDSFVYTGTLTETEDAGDVTIDEVNYTRGTNTAIWVFTKNSRIIYIVADIAEVAYGASDAQYGILLEVNKDKDEDDETIYVATVLVDGEEETYECDSSVRDLEEGSFISFKVTDGEFKYDPTVLVHKDFTEVVEDVKDDTDYIGYKTVVTGEGEEAVTSYTLVADEDTLAFLVELELVDDETATNGKTYEAIKVDSVEVVDGATYVVFEDESTIDLAKGYIVYDLSEGEMADEIDEGDYILWANDEEEEGEFEIVVIL